MDCTGPCFIVACGRRVAVWCQSFYLIIIGLICVTVGLEAHSHKDWTELLTLPAASEGTYFLALVVTVVPHVFETAEVGPSGEHLLVWVM